MDNLEDLKAENSRLTIALDAAVKESKRLANELVDTEEGRQLVSDLLRLLVGAWREGEDLTPIIKQVEETLRLCQSAN